VLPFLWYGLPELLWPVFDRATLPGMEKVSGKRPYPSQFTIHYLQFISRKRPFLPHNFPVTNCCFGVGCGKRPSPSHHFKIGKILQRIAAVFASQIIMQEKGV
jgi:hypothetical protein